MKRLIMVAWIVGLLVLGGTTVPSALAQYDDHSGHGTSTMTPVGNEVDKLVGQIRVAITHATFSLNETQLTPRQTHAHHVINIIEGTKGPNFNASKGNPGDGHGALNYARTTIRTETTTEWVDNTLLYLQWANEAAIAATKTNNYAEAGTHVQRALAFLSAALGRSDDQGRLGGALAIQAALSKVIVVDILDFVFGDGKDLVIPVGTTVVWVNRDTAPHTVTGGPLVSPILNLGDAFTYTFDKAGTIDYLCAFHPTMKQRVVVK